MNHKYTFTLTGAFTPYVRMTRRGKFVQPRAQEYIASQSALEIQYANQMALNDWEILPAHTPLSISILVFMPANHLHCQDADNQLKALIDAAKGIVFPSDMWIDEIFFTRHTDILSEFKVQFAVWIKEKE